MDSDQVVNLIQTIALVVATSIAVVAYFAGRYERKEDRDGRARERQQERDERRIERVADRVTELHAAALVAVNAAGQADQFFAARSRLRSSLALTDEFLPACRALIDPAVNSKMALELAPKALYEISEVLRVVARADGKPGRIEGDVARVPRDPREKTP